MSPDGALIAVGGWTRATDADPQEQIYLFDRASGALRQRIDGLPNVFRLTFSRDGSLLAATLGCGGLRLYDRDQGWAEVARDEHYVGQATGRPSRRTDGWRLPHLDGQVRLYAADLEGDSPPQRHD